MMHSLFGKLGANGNGNGVCERIAKQKLWNVIDRRRMCLREFWAIFRGFIQSTVVFYVTCIHEPDK